ncbi:MAG: signal peptidase II, partial [Sphingomonadales bacterium]|nr:signal peptidase II [Sphingomonadales bacterium]
MTDSSQIKKYRRIGLFIAFVIFVLDQASKFVVMDLLQLPVRGQIELLPFFNLTWAENYGVSMGFLTASTDFQRWALVALTGLIGIAVFVWMNREKAKWD